MDMFAIVKNIFEPIKTIISNILITILVIALSSSILFLLYFIIRYRVNIFKPNLDKLKKQTIKFKPYDFLRWLIIDLKSEKIKSFNEYGFTFYVGRQGAGKTISMVHYLNRMKEKYPECLIVTNFAYAHANHRMRDWQDFFKIRNEDKGVIFAIDEIHSEYSSESWKDFPENLLSEISQQRKQRVKIVATAQVFNRVAKQLREQAFSVVVCQTFFKRFVKNKEYDANDYANGVNSNAKLKEKCKPISKHSFIQSDYLRNCYDTYEKIKRMRDTKFINRNER